MDHLALGGCSVLNALVGLGRPDPDVVAGMVYFGSDGNIYAWDQTGHPTPGVNSVLLTSYAAGQWYDVRIDLDYSLKTFDVFIDGILRGHAIPILDDLTNKMPNAVRIGAGHGPYPVAWFDDVKVTDISACTPPPSGMVSWWPGDGNANDLIGTNHGTPGGDTTYAPGVVGQAFSFDGVNDYVDVGDVDLPATFTIDAWIRPNNVTDFQVIMSKDDVNTQRSYYFQLEGVLGPPYNLPGGTLVGLVRNSGGGATSYRTNSGVVTAGGWQHVAMVYDGNAGAAKRCCSM